MGGRLYDPNTARFLSTDPIYGGNANPYVYPTDPIDATDVTGKSEGDPDNWQYPDGDDEGYRQESSEESGFEHEEQEETASRARQIHARQVAEEEELKAEDLKVYKKSQIKKIMANTGDDPEKFKEEFVGKKMGGFTTWPETKTAFCGSPRLSQVPDTMYTPIHILAYSINSAWPERPANHQEVFMPYIINIELDAEERLALWTGILEWPGSVASFDEVVEAMTLAGVEDLVLGTGAVLRYRLRKREALSNVNWQRLLDLIALVQGKTAVATRLIRDVKADRTISSVQEKIAKSLTVSGRPAQNEMTSEYYYSHEPAEVQVLGVSSEEDDRPHLIHGAGPDQPFSMQVEEASLMTKASLWVSNDVLSGQELEKAIGVRADTLESIGELIRPPFDPKPEAMSTWLVRSHLPRYAHEEEHLDVLWHRAARALYSLQTLPGTTEVELAVVRKHNGGQWQGHGSTLEPAWIKLLARLSGSFGVDAYVEPEEDFREAWRAITS